MKVIKDLNTEIIYPVLVEDGQGLANYPNGIVFLADKCICEDVIKKLSRTLERDIWNYFKRRIRQSRYIKGRERKDQKNKQSCTLKTTSGLTANAVIPKR
jgi:hypothetical protein